MAAMTGAWRPRQLPQARPATSTKVQHFCVMRAGCQMPQGGWGHMYGRSKTTWHMANFLGVVWEGISVVVWR